MPQFYPTYKQQPGRPVLGAKDYADPKWVERAYVVAVKEPWYKGGRTRARCPGWCDRILCPRPPGAVKRP
jgi:hypothetical protein